MDDDTVTELEQSRDVNASVPLLEAPGPNRNDGTETVVEPHGEGGQVDVLLSSHSQLSPYSEFEDGSKIILEPPVHVKKQVYTYKTHPRGKTARFIPSDAEYPEGSKNNWGQWNIYEQDLSRYIRQTDRRNLQQERQRLRRQQRRD